MKATELREKSVEDLSKELLTQLESQFRLRMQKNTGQLNQSHLMKETRREVARIKTLLSEKSREKAGNI